MPAQSSCAPHTPSQEMRNGGLVMDPAPLLQQLQLFQDQLRLFASPVPAAADLQTPEQAKLAEQQAATVKSRPAVEAPATSAVHQRELSFSALRLQPTAGQPAISSHDSFRQAMMERLSMERHLAQTLSTTQTHIESPVSYSSVIGRAPSSQRVLSPSLQMPVHRKGPGTVSSADGEAVDGTPVSTVLGKATADTSASASSPASRALTSIRSMLRSLPEAFVPVRPESVPDASAEKGSSVPRAAELSSLRRASSSRATGLMDTAMEERGSNASSRISQDGAATARGRSSPLSGNPSGVERELVRLLGPRFASADISPDASLTEPNRAKGSCDGGLVRSTSGRYVLLYITSRACMPKVVGNCRKQGACPLWLDSS